MNRLHPSMSFHRRPLHAAMPEAGNPPGALSLTRLLAVLLLGLFAALMVSGCGRRQADVDPQTGGASRDGGAVSVDGSTNPAATPDHPPNPDSGGKKGDLVPSQGPASSAPMGSLSGTGAGQRSNDAVDVRSNPGGAPTLAGSAASGAGGQ